MTSARVDFASVDHAFDLAVTGYSRDTVAWAAGYLGEKANTGLEVHRKLDKNWDEMWVELVAKGDGFVQMNLQGEWYSAERPDDIRYVWVDDVSVEGSSIVNGGFEDAGPDGKPAGWSCGNATGKYYSRDGSIAHGGKCCVAISIAHNVLSQKFAVKKGGTYRVHAFFRVADPARMPERIAVNEYNVQFYSQQVKVTFTSEQAAKKASLRIAPLFEGCLWSMGSRWDDNNGGDLLMRDCLARHGHHGTYYLNGLYRDWPDATPTCNSAFVKDLLRTGDSIGAHSLTHPFLSYCNRNRIFEEVLGDRILLEAAGDRPVSSYVFSFCNFINAQDGLAVQADIHRVLERAGFINCANEADFDNVKSDITLSPILPGDGADIDAAVESALGNPDYQAAHPSMTYSMHMYYNTPAKWAKFEGQLEKYGRRPDWWYCNQNQYGAYRLQFAMTRLHEPKVEGKTLTLTINRPVLIDLNDEQPLTLEVMGVNRDEVAGVACPTADFRAVGRRRRPTTTARAISCSTCITITTSRCRPGSACLRPTTPTARPSAPTTTTPTSPTSRACCTSRTARSRSPWRTTPGRPSRTCA